MHAPIIYFFFLNEKIRKTQLRTFSNNSSMIDSEHFVKKFFPLPFLLGNKKKIIPHVLSFVSLNIKHQVSILSIL